MAEEERGDLPHPRQRHGLVGHLAAERAILDGAGAGRLHHAWLIGGPAGIGKATLAYRAARYLLAKPQERTGENESLAVDPASRTARLVASGSHPNLIAIDLALAAADVDKPPARTIPVRTMRRALAFFGSTAADGGHRVCIIDAIDEANAAGANALLKTLEEPPARSTIFIVAHAAREALPTIRSRCRKLTLAPLRPDEVREVLRTLGPAVADAGGEMLGRAAELSDGSVRRALSFLDPKRLALLDEVSGLLALLPDSPAGRVLALADRLADRKREGDFELVLDAIQLWTSERVSARASLGPARLAPLAELCENIAVGARSVETFNLDRRPFVLSMFGDLAQAIRLAG